MARIILDYSANTFKNDPKLIKRAINEIKQVDTGRHEIIFKTQLFTKAGDNIPCTHESFKYMYEYGNSKGYKVTASVFDKESLDFLLKFDIPFVKIANRRDLDYLTNLIPRGIMIYKSMDSISLNYDDNGYIETDNPYDIYFACVSEYPAKIESYTENVLFDSLENISDHTVGLEMFKGIKSGKYKKELSRINLKRWEKHLKLSDSTGLDAGSFAITPQELKEIL